MAISRRNIRKELFKDLNINNPLNRGISISFTRNVNSFIYGSTYVKSLKIVNPFIKDGKLIYGKIIFNDEEIRYGDFFEFENGFDIINGEIIFPDGKKVNGQFSEKTGYLIKGKIIHSYGQIDEGEFDEKTGYLIKGKIIHNDGQIDEGEYDKETGYLIKGKIINNDGQIDEGEFDKETGYLIKGKSIHNNGKIDEGEFDKETGYLIKK